MKNKFTLIGIAAALSFASFAAQSAEVTLKAVDVFAQNPFYAKRFTNFVKKFNAEGKGLVQIQYIGGVEVMPAFEVGNALRAGVIDMAHTTGVFQANLVPELLTLSFSSVPMATVRKNGGYELMNQILGEKANMVWLGRSHEGHQFHIYTTKKPTNDSFADMKLRSVPVYRAFFQSLGALPIQVPPGEVYTALERGVVDGYGWPSVGIFDLGWNEKTKYRIDPGFYSVEVSLYMNRDKWKKLDDKQRAFVEAHVKELETLYQEDYIAAEKEKERQAAAGIEGITLSPSHAAEFLAKAEEAGWKAIEQASPKYAPQLRKAFNPK